MAKAKTKVNKVEPTMNQISFAFLKNTFFCKACHKKVYWYQSRKEKQLKILILYSAALSYTVIIQNKNPEAMQNSEP